MRGRPPSAGVLGALVPHERGIFDLLDRQAATLPRAGELLEAVVHHWPDRDDRVAELVATREQAEAAGDDVFAHVHASFVTSLEREDLLGLSGAMTAVVEHMERTAALMGAYRVERAREPARRITHTAAAGSRELAVGVASLRRRKALPSVVEELRGLELEMERLLRDALSDLIADAPSPAELLAWRDVYDELEQVHPALVSATRTLRAIALKGS